MTLGQRIKQIRENHFLSQEEFAEKLNTTRQTVSRWELDQTYPEIGKIVMMSKIFSVSTDSILKDGISTFDTEAERYSCGIWRGSSMEIAETEYFSLVLYCSSDKNIFGMKLYCGYEAKKKMTAICERDLLNERTEYAYFVKDSNPHIAVTNSERLASELGGDYDTKMKNNMRMTESFSVDHTGAPLPTVKEAGIPKCLTLWRMGDRYFADQEEMNFSLCTERTEYIFSIRFENTNIYCGASYNTVFDLGIFGDNQYFRIRNYKDNSEDYCRFFFDFSAEHNEIKIPVEQFELGKCIRLSAGLMWCLKRYNDDEIVLQGCGDDEYIYRRNDKRVERFQKT